LVDSGGSPTPDPAEKTQGFDLRHRNVGNVG
jgi:hypothetical protein